MLDVDAAVAVGEEDQLERLVEPIYRSALSNRYMDILVEPIYRSTLSNLYVDILVEPIYR